MCKARIGLIEFLGTILLPVVLENKRICKGKKMTDHFLRALFMQTGFLSQMHLFLDSFLVTALEK